MENIDRAKEQLNLAISKLALGASSSTLKFIEDVLFEAIGSIETHEDLGRCDICSELTQKENLVFNEWIYSDECPNCRKECADARDVAQQVKTLTYGGL